MSTTTIYTSLTDSKTSSSKLWHLEGLRGIASLSVAIFHLLCALAPRMLLGNPPYSKVSHYPVMENFLRHTPIAVLLNGEFMVVIFFLLSGRVLALSYLNSRELEKLVSAVVRRGLRLGLPVLVVHLILLILVKMKAFEGVPTFKQITSSQWVVKPIDEWNSFSHFWARTIEWLTMPLTSDSDVPKRLDNYPAGVIWTISFEFWCSIWVYFVAVVASNLKTNRWLFYAFIILWNIWAVSWTSAFFIGLLFCDLNLSGYFHRLEICSKFISLPLKFILFIIFYLPQIPEVLSYIQVLVPRYLFTGTGIGFPSAPLSFFQARVEWIIPASALLLLIEISPALRNFLSHHFFVWLGQLSFGLYLLHGFVMQVLMSRMFVMLIEGANFQYWSAAVIVWALYTPLCLFFAWGFYHLVDKPSVRLSQKIEKLLFGENETWTITGPGLERKLIYPEKLV